MKIKGSEKMVKSLFIGQVCHHFSVVVATSELPHTGHQQPLSERDSQRLALSQVACIKYFEGLIGVSLQFTEVAAHFNLFLLSLLFLS